MILVDDSRDIPRIIAETVCGAVVQGQQPPVETVPSAEETSVVVGDEAGNTGDVEEML